MISATAPRSTSRATLITGLLGSGKTWQLTNQLLQAARTPASTPYLNNQEGSLLALSGHGDYTALRAKVDLDRPLGCTKCEVETFPAVVRTIVHEFGPTVGSYTPADVRLLDRGSLSVFLHRNLDAMPLGRYRPLHNPGDAVRPLLGLFSSLAHCGVTPADYLRYVQTLEAELEHQVAVVEHALPGESGEAAASGATPTRVQLRTQLEAEAWRAHVAGERDKANTYEAFAALKRREEVSDYSDHLLLARRILKDSATARTTLSLRLSHVYVDDLHEYSPAMVDIVAGLVAPGVGITAAVDPLLATRSAGVAADHAFGDAYTATARFKKAFPETAEVPIVDHRRSTDAIQVAMIALGPRDVPVAAKRKSKKAAKKNDPVVTAAGAAAGAAAVGPTTAALGEETVASTAVDSDRTKLTCLTFETEGDELRALGRRVKDLIDRGVSPDDIGVAAVGGWGVTDTLVAALHTAGVPVEGGRRFSSVFDSETPRMLMSFLRCLVHPSESTPLLHLLMRCPAYELPRGELTAALEGHLSRYIPLRSFLLSSHVGEGVSTDPRGDDGVSVGARRIAGRLLSDVNRFAEASRKQGARKVMLDFLRYTGQLERLEEPTTSEEEREGRAVAELFELTAMAEKQAGGDNVALVEPILRLFRRHGAGYGDSTRFDHEGMAGEAEDSSGGAVRVFHPGKDGEVAGRSFSTVFIPFCSRARIPGNLRTARLPVPGPFRGAPEPRDTRSLREEANLARVCHENRARAMLYAAVGSASQDVCFSVSARISRGKTHLAPSPFLAEILGNGAPREWKTTAAAAAVTSNEDGSAAADVPDLACSEEGWPGVAAATVADEMPPAGVLNGGARKDFGAERPLRLSYSSISSYESCPHSYYLQHVLNVSPPPNPRMVYGRAMHEAVATVLRAAVRRGSSRGGSPPTLEGIVEKFNDHFSGCAFESAAQVQTLTENGVAGLESFLSRLMEGGIRAARSGGEGIAREDDEPFLRPRLLIERKFMVKIPEVDVVLSGIFDRVDVASTSVEGSSRRPSVSVTDYKSNVGTKDPARMVRDNLQLRLYSLAAERLFGVMPSELAIESIEDGRRGVTAPSAADTELALEAISATAAAVREGRFDATPSFQACTFCGFKHMCQHSSVTSAAL